MATEHTTPEPWDWEDCIITAVVDGETIVVADVNNNTDDARRLVACVNACAGISTTALEQAGADSIKRILAAAGYLLSGPAA